MAETPDYGADILVDGSWIPVSTLESDGITISNGRQKDAGSGDPLTISATIINQDGELTPRNPQSSLFGKLGQNTQLRVTTPEARHLWVASRDADLGHAQGASTPNNAAYNVTDLDVRIDVEPAGSWRASLGWMLAGKYVPTGNQRSWSIHVNEDMIPYVIWSTDGTSAGLKAIYNDVPIPVSGSQRIGLRYTIDVDNGAGQISVRFFYMPGGGVSGTWTQFGQTWQLTAGGTTTIFASTAPLVVGHPPNSVSAGNSPFRVYAFRLCAGLLGSAVANPDFTAPAAGTTSFVDSTGRTWTVDPESDIREYKVSGVGELAKWPTRWTTFEELKTAPVTAYGLRKRLARPSGKLRSPLFREAVSEANLPRMVEYWSGEDASGASGLASGVADGSPMLITGTPSLAASDRIPGSEPLLTLASGASLRGSVRFHADTGEIAFRMVCDFPDDFTAPAYPFVMAEITCAAASTSSKVKWWRLMVDAGGAVRLIGLGSGYQTIAGAVGGNIAYDLFGRRQMFGFNVVQNGSNVDWFTFARRIADDYTVSQVQFASTFTGVSFGRAQEVKVAQNGDMDGVTVGHFMIGNDQDLAAGIDTAIVGNAGELASNRFYRLGRELGILTRAYGVSAESARLGPQQADTAIALFDMIADTDGGVIVDARDELALEFYTRASIYNGAIRAPITYDQPGQSPALLPEEPGDDVINDMTMEKIGGSSYRAVETEGPLGTVALGYALDASDSLNFQLDDQLSDAAWWVTFLRTWDEFVYPEVEFDLYKLSVLGDSAIARAVELLGITGRMVITNPPADLPKHPIELLAQGWTETLRKSYHHIVFNTSPGRPWIVGKFGITPFESDGTTLHDPIGALDATFLVDVVGTPWATDSAFPLIMWVGKRERISVTAIGAAVGGVQQFTATRGIDGDAMAHDAGETLELWEPLRLAR